MTTTTYARKDRRQADASVKHGPTHIVPPDGLSLCGRRLRGFMVASINRPDETILCPACLAAERSGSRKAWKA